MPCILCEGLPSSLSGPPPNRRRLPSHSACDRFVTSLCRPQHLISVGHSGGGAHCHSTCPGIKTRRSKGPLKREGPGGSAAGGLRCGGEGGAGDWAPLTWNRRRKGHRPPRPSDRIAPTPHAEGRMGDCPGPRNATATRRHVTRGEGGIAQGLGPSQSPGRPRTRPSSRRPLRFVGCVIDVAAGECGRMPVPRPPLLAVVDCPRHVRWPDDGGAAVDDPPPALGVAAPGAAGVAGRAGCHRVPAPIGRALLHRPTAQALRVPCPMGFTSGPDSSARLTAGDASWPGDAMPGGGGGGRRPDRQIIGL